jgi:aldehyde:ferredoxin oxidoreductase
MLDKSKFEEFKTRFFKLQGWDPESGFPRRSTLQALGLSRVADELERNRKLGKEDGGG